MLGSSSTTRTRAPPPSLLTALMLPRLPVSLLGNGCGLAWVWPPREPLNRALAVDQPSRQPARLEPADGGLAHHDRRRRGDVGVQAGPRDHGGRAPWANAREARGRVDDVVKNHAAAGPSAHRRTRGG